MFSCLHIFLALQPLLPIFKARNGQGSLPCAVSL